MPSYFRYRQIHLDFHTSEHLATISGEFDAGAWAQMLPAAQVDSSTCFARGHHGMIFKNNQERAEIRRV